ncbi:hypothetical protein LEMLEM_LOCUS6778 [Lemmus lemmus]
MCHILLGSKVPSCQIPVQPGLNRWCQNHLTTDCAFAERCYFWSKPCEEPAQCLKMTTIHCFPKIQLEKKPSARLQEIPRGCHLSLGNDTFLLFPAKTVKPSCHLLQFNF